MTFVALESLNFGATLLRASSKKVTTSDQGSPRGGGPMFRGSEKQIVEKTRATPGKYHANGSKMGAKIRIVGVF